MVVENKVFSRIGYGLDDTAKIEQRGTMITVVGKCKGCRKK
jgi:hypothetical protein